MMKTDSPTLRLGVWGTMVNAAGILLSGLIGLILVVLVHPSPIWQTPQLWAENFHPVQTVPFFFGFLLVVGYLIMMAVLHDSAEAQDKAHTLTALLRTAAFSALTFFNYISQTTFLPALARDYRPEYDVLISGLSLANPHSLCWAIEMWGYALLGGATLLAARVLRRNRIERLTAWLMVINGILSIIGGVVTALELGWVMAPAGFISYILWNAVVFAMAIFLMLSLRKRLAAGGN
jgi:hypothetical protein